ncbi:MAG: hypothetical protein HUU46_10095 [Candidatus Hydrogenedentes bacterium]|nr:hypothetical protein [Candidatus Hydrogenedentota bacterium]
MMSLAYVTAAMLGAVFEVHTFPVGSQSAQAERAEVQTFFASADADGVADLFMLQGNTLSVAASSIGLRETTLPRGVTAFDIADIDADGKFEVVAVTGAAIVRLPLALQGDPVEPARLFDADSLYAQAFPIPTPAVLVIPGNDPSHVMVALPASAALEYRSLDGTLVRSEPYAESKPETHVFRPATFRSAGQLTIGNFTSSIVYRLDSHPVSSEQRNDAEEYVAVDVRTRGTARLLRGAAGDEPANWPWFVVRREQAKTTRAYCAVEESLNTLIRMSDVAVDADGMPSSIAKPGPERRYPGALIPIGDTPPDFNGDGYADVLLWNAPRAGISVDALLRAVVGRNWPITLTAHTYSPDKGRFEPSVASDLTFRIPVTWFLTGGVPLRHYVLADFNGDKKTDLAMCTEENEYSVWLYKDGFPTTPDEKHTFTENITGVELTADVAGNGKSSIVLRSDHYIYALYAK